MLDNTRWHRWWKLSSCGVEDLPSLANSLFRNESAHLLRKNTTCHRLIQSCWTTVNFGQLLFLFSSSRVAAVVHTHTHGQFNASLVTGFIWKEKEPCHQTLHKVVAEIRLSSWFPTALGKLPRLKGVTKSEKSSTWLLSMNWVNRGHNGWILSAGSLTWPRKRWRTSPRSFARESWLFCYLLNLSTGVNHNFYEWLLGA